MPLCDARSVRSLTIKLTLHDHLPVSRTWRPTPASWSRRLNMTRLALRREVTVPRRATVIIIEPTTGGREDGKREVGGGCGPVDKTERRIKPARPRSRGWITRHRGCSTHQFNRLRTSQISSKLGLAINRPTGAQLQHSRNMRFPEKFENRCELYEPPIQWMLRLGILSNAEPIPGHESVRNRIAQAKTF